MIEVTAHYDTQGVNVPGGDDNGSGLGAMIEMMRLYKIHKPKRTIRFVFMDLEERGMQGSILHNALPWNPAEKILGILVMDMFGYTPEISRWKLEKGEKPPFILEVGVLSDYNKGKNPIGYLNSLIFTEALSYQFHKHPRNLDLFVQRNNSIPGSADHGPYQKHGRPGILASVPYKYDYITKGYHTPGDTLYQIHWPFYEEVVRYLIEGLSLVAQADYAGEAQPTKDPLEYGQSYTGDKEF